MRLPQMDLPPPSPLSRRHFLGLLGMGSLTLAGPFTASAATARSLDLDQGTFLQGDVSNRGDKPRSINGWLLRESDI